MITPPLARIGPAVIPVHRRAVWFTIGTLLALLVACVLTLTLGRLAVPLADLPSALFGGAEGSVRFALEKLRGPRLLTAVLVGALLGVSGALFQAVTRNPLGSPDVIGLGAGAGAGVAVAGLVLTGVPTPVGAVGGAAIATALVFLSTGRGFRSPARVIIAGIGVAAIGHAITQYVVSTQLRDAAAKLAGYLAGSLNASTMQDVAVAGIALTLVLPAALVLAPSLGLMQLGDATAAGLGANPDRVRTAAILVSVVAAGAAVAAAGPIAFVALTAPQIAARMTRVPAAGPITSAVTGSLILVVADLAAANVPALAGLPVGVVTLGVGGVYLGWLLVREWKKGRL